jgi:hypothetical protein
MPPIYCRYCNSANRCGIERIVARYRDVNANPRNKGKTMRNQNCEFPDDCADPGVFNELKVAEARVELARGLPLNGF